MSVNKYFDHLYNTNEQDLFIDIVQESIQIHGCNATYIPRFIEKFDELLREEKLSVFNTTYEIDVYVTNAGQNANMQKTMSRFGFRFDETTEVIVSAKSWDLLGTGFNQPREGDLLYLGNPNDQYASFVNCMFQINNIWDGHPDPFVAGAVSSYRLTLNSVNKSHNNVVDTPYDDINAFLNADSVADNKTTIKKMADDFADINVIPSGNPFTKFGGL